MLQQPRSLGICAVPSAGILFVLTLCARVDAENWPAWRGPEGDGLSSEKHLPIRWSRDEHVRWKVDLPEPGNSTPIIWGDRVFLTQPVNGGKRRTLLCLDRRSGKKQWQSGVSVTEMEPTHRTNPYCSPSPVTDGERVIAWFGNVGLVAYDFSGKELWRRPLGKIDHVFGYGSSPVIHRDLCFLNFGPGSREFAVGVRKTSGEVAWKLSAPGPLKRPAAGRDVYGTWSTPIVARTNTRDELIFCFRNRISSHNPTTGKILWTCDGLGPQMKASPVAGEGVVVALGGKDSSSLAVQLGGKGDVTKSRALWRVPRARSRLGTGVIHEGHLYVNRRNGVVECIELKTGKVVWEKRHQGPGATSDTWASLFLANGKIYAINQSADTFVIEASPEYELLATNSLDEYTNSSIAGSQGNIFIRTHDALWCLGETGDGD